MKEVNMLQKWNSSTDKRV